MISIAIVKSVCRMDIAVTTFDKDQMTPYLLVLLKLDDISEL